MGTDRSTRSLAMQRLLAQRDIDTAAAEARGRAATQGMDMVYAAKLQQAQQYLQAIATDAQAPVPPYVAADVAVDEINAQQAAQAIVAAAQQFHDQAGPAIEQARRHGKQAVRAAADAEAVASALDAALQALRTL